MPQGRRHPRNTGYKDPANSVAGNKVVHDDENERRALPRRAVVRAALAGAGGAAVGPLLPLAWGGGAAEAAPATPGSGQLVTPDPIEAGVPPSEVAVELVPFSTPPATASEPPRALLQMLYTSPDGRLFLNDARGKLYEVDRQTGGTTLFLDVAAALDGRLLIAPGPFPGTTNSGFRGFAFHPDFSRRGQLGFRRFYTATCERPSGSPTIPSGQRRYTTRVHNVLAEWRANDAGTAAIPTSRRQVIRFAAWADDHNPDTPMFNPRALPGDADYGKLYIGVGDGGNRPRSPDPYNLAQDRGVALGKILRIDPLASGGRRYTVPADNPFVGRAGTLPEIWALGLRHPQNLSFDRGGSGAFIVTDIGQRNIEEVNLGVAGANYGWPLREGTFVTDRAGSEPLYGLPADDASYGFTYPVAQYDHDEGKAIAGGYVYRGSAVPGLVGHYLFGDIRNGRVFHVPVDSLAPGQQAAFKELRLLRGGAPVTLRRLVGVANNRVDLRFGQDQTGEVYVMTKQEGVVYRLRAA
jgi:glucose/arabinose dehydrogenase